MEFKRFDPSDPALRDLIAHHAAHGDAHYPAESNHHMDGATLGAQGVVLFVGLIADQPVAMGGWMSIGGTAAELKSMHVLEEARGQGAAAHIVSLILEDMRRAGCSEVYLETGALPGSAAARRLYHRAGFEECPPFGAYVEDPNSVFMRRDL